MTMAFPLSCSSIASARRATVTPPCFVWHTWEDNGVPVENSLNFAAALRQAKVPFDLHIYEKGQHGIGLAAKPPFRDVHPWARDCVFWLQQRGFVRPRP
jgi:acetyl esterase/lipase